jgi:hypothetical protein
MGMFSLCILESAFKVELLVSFVLAVVFFCFNEFLMLYFLFPNYDFVFWSRVNFYFVYIIFSEKRFYFLV